MPSSSRAWASSAVSGSPMISSASIAGPVGVDAPGDGRCWASSTVSAVGVAVELSPLDRKLALEQLASGPSSTRTPPRPSRPRRRRGRQGLPGERLPAVVPAPATPRMSDTFDTRPSLTPNTALAPRPPARCGGGARREAPSLWAPAPPSSARRSRLDRTPVACPRADSLRRHEVELADLLGGEPRYRVDQVWQGSTTARRARRR